MSAARILIMAVVAAGVALLPACRPGSGDPQEGAPVPEVDLSSAEPRVAATLAAASRAVSESPSSASTWGHLGRCFDAHAYYEAAWECYLEAWRLDPSDYRWSYLAALARRRTAPHEALPLFAAAADLGPEEPAFYINYGDTLFESGTAVAAEPQYRTALRLDPDNTHALYGVARVELAAGEVRRAVETLERASEITLAHGEVHTLLAQLYSRLGDTGRAALAERRSRAFPGASRTFDPVYAEVLELAVSSRAYTTRGRNLASRGDFAGAEKQFRIALEMRPNSARNHSNLAASLAGQGRREEALALYATALEIDPREPHALQNLAQALAEQGDLEAAADHARQATEVDPGLAEAFWTLARIQVRRRQTERAAENYREALQLNPGLTTARGELAGLLFAAGHRQEGIATLRAGIDINPDDHETRYNLGAALAGLGNHADAIEVFREGLQRAPNSSAFTIALAWELATAADTELRDPATALQLAGRVYARYPDRPRVVDVWSAALAATGRFEEAARAAGQAARLAREQGQTLLADQVDRRVEAYRRKVPFRAPP